MRGKGTKSMPARASQPWGTFGDLQTQMQTSQAAGSGAESAFNEAGAFNLA